MDPIEEQLAQLKLYNSLLHSPKDSLSLLNGPDDSVLVDEIASSDNSKRVGPAVPPKPNRKNFNRPEIPHSVVVSQTCEPLYSKRLQSDSISKGVSKPNAQLNITGHNALSLNRKQLKCGTYQFSNNKVTLDNPAILDQQLEALEYHKKQLERKGLLQKKNILKSSGLFMNGTENERNSGPNSRYSNLPTNIPSTSLECTSFFDDSNNGDTPILYTNLINNQQPLSCNSHRPGHFLYTNVNYINDGIDDLPPPPPFEVSPHLSNTIEFISPYNTAEDDIPPPPSPVSSSYSELRRATDMYPKSPVLTFEGDNSVKLACSTERDNADMSQNRNTTICMYPISQQQTYMNMRYNDYNVFGSFCSQRNINRSNSDYYGYGSFSQGSSTYESIYEPINPRPPSQISLRSNYLPYTPYVNSSQVSEVETTSSPITEDSIISTNSNGKLQAHKEAEVEALTDLLVQSMNTANEVDSFGVCIACKERVIGENSGCTAMDQIYHISCFTCSQCQINLQGKPFYALDGKPYCEVDYLNTLEKCSVCMNPILERILRATGKPYHPQCFTCVVCGKSLDGIPFTVDATNQNYCISDFHKKFAPRCCVCKQPIMPEPGQEETVRVVALDRSFHFECYKCEDCGLLLSSEAEGRGCYPLDDHVLCKSCNAKRVQMLTSRMTTEL